MPPQDLKRRKAKYGQRNSPALVIDDATSTEIVNASFSTLPDELLIEILSYLTQTDALSLIQTAKRFKRPCEIRLYRRIILSNTAPDAFLQYVSSLPGKTIISTRSNILRFLRMMHIKTRLQSEDLCLSYVEEIVSFGNVSDLGNNVEEVAEIRQLLITFIESCPNLNSLVLPLTMLSRLRFLTDRSVGRLQRFSFKMSPSDAEPSAEVYLPSLKNAESVTINYIECIPFFASALSNLATRAPLLKELELCWMFGAEDRVIREDLAFNRPERILSPLRLFEMGMKAASDSRDRQGFYGYVEPPSAEIFFKKYTSYSDFSDLMKHTNRAVLGYEDTKSISEVSLSKLTLSNWRFSKDDNVEEHEESEDLTVEDWLLAILQKSLESERLEELHIVNCVTPTIHVASRYKPVIQGLAMLFRSKEFQQYKHLKKLTIGQVEECLSDPAFGGTKHNQVLEGLSQFSLQTHSKLTHICIHGDNDWDLQNVLLPILIRMKDSLLHFTFFNRSNVNNVMRKVVTIKAMHKVLQGGDAFALDKQLSQEEKMMAQFVYCTHALNNYEHRNPCDPIPESTISEYFKREFIYLYKDQVVPFFKELPKLRTFTLYGYPFRRSDVM